MRIPETRGKMMLSPNQLRMYGAGGFVLDGAAQRPGCPALWKARYVDHVADAGGPSYPLEYGSMFHAALHLMEEEPIGPDAALERVWPPTLGPEAFVEAQADMEAYLERGGPMARFGTVATELELEALLYVDDDFGEVWLRGFVDWLGVDVELPSVLHVVDYKTSRSPGAASDVGESVQLMAYDWLVRQNWGRWMSGSPQTVVHLDLIKWADREHRFSAGDIEMWQAWATAIARTILRDDEAEPILNPSCGWCPVKMTCPKFLALPGEGDTMADRKSAVSLADRWAWREDAAKKRRVLDAAIKQIDGDVRDHVVQTGFLMIDGTVWEMGDDWKDTVDVLALSVLLGDRFWDVCTVPKGRLAGVLDEMGAGERTKAAVADCFVRQPVGVKVRKRKATADD